MLIMPGRRSLCILESLRNANTENFETTLCIVQFCLSQIPKNSFYQLRFKQRENEQLPSTKKHF